jgi:sarcosine oxidase, subunit gamma
MPEPAPPVAIRQLPHAGKLLLRGGPDARRRASDALGFPLPERPPGAGAGDGAEALRLGPDEWLLLVPSAAADEVAEALARELDGLHHALVPVGERLVGIAVEGPAAADLLATGCPLDLHPRAFPPGSATRTVMGKADVVLHRPEGGSGFRLHVGRSFGPYLWRYLETAAREFLGAHGTAA